MACNGPGRICGEKGRGRGQPDTETLQMTSRQQEHCPDCGGFLTAEGACKKCAGKRLDAMISAQQILLGATQVGTGTSTQIHGATTAPVKMTIDKSFWGVEFGKMRGTTVTLSNGVTATAGESWTDPRYCAQFGKKQRRCTASATLLRAVDLEKFQTVRGSRGQEITMVEMDGEFAYYDHEARQAVCTCGENPCPHQVRAMLLGETNDRQDGAQQERSQLWGMLQGIMAKRQAGAHVTLSQLAQANDAAYAYLSTVEPTIQFGSEDLAAEVEGQEGFAKKVDQCPQCKAFLTADGRCNKCGFPDAQQDGEENEDPLPTEGDAVEPGAEVHKALGDIELPLPGHEENLPDWLRASIPEHDTGFRVTSVAERVFKTMRATLRTRWTQMKNQFNEDGAWSTKMTGRAFGLYGPPSTGKNAATREVAAALRLPYVEVDVNAATDFQRLIGEVVLKDGDTKAQLGKIGRALVEGSVAVINEVVSADPAIQTALHQAAQDGVFSIPGPEGAEETFHVHPNSVLVLTWNPGGGMADRPTEALSSRLVNLHVPLPTESEEREILASRLREDFGLPIQPTDVEEDVRFFREIRGLADSGTLAVKPGFRNLMHFSLMRLQTGDPDFALEQVLIAADQDPMARETTAFEIRKMYMGRHWETR